MSGITIIIITTIDNITIIMKLSSSSSSPLSSSSPSHLFHNCSYGDMLALGHGEEKDELLPKRLNFSRTAVKNITVTQVTDGDHVSFRLLYSQRMCLLDYLDYFIVT